MDDHKKSCEQTIRWERGQFAAVPVACSQVIGLRTWTDETGRDHAACRYHYAGLAYRYPAMEPNIAAFLTAERAAHDGHERLDPECSLCDLLMTAEGRLVRAG